MVARRAGSGGGDGKWSDSEAILKVEPKGLPMDWMQGIRKRQGWRLAWRLLAWAKHGAALGWAGHWVEPGSGAPGAGCGQAWLEAAPRQPRTTGYRKSAVQGEGPSLGSDLDIHEQIDGAHPKPLTHILTSNKTPKTGPFLKVWVKSFGSKPWPNLTQKLFILSIFIPLSVNIYTIVLQKYEFVSSWRNAPESAGGAL